MLAHMHSVMMLTYMSAYDIRFFYVGVFYSTDLHLYISDASGASMLALVNFKMAIERSRHAHNAIKFKHIGPSRGQAVKPSSIVPSPPSKKPNPLA